MKKILRNRGWLVMAAALTLGMTACSSEDSITEQPTQQPTQTAQTVHVTVGAGIDDGQTRAVVEQTGTSRTLKFTAGDKLWVVGQKHIKEGDYWYDIQGQLAIGTIGSDGTTAEFSGNLTVNKWKESAPDLDLSSLEGLFATLIPAGSTYFNVETNPDNGREELIHQPDGIATGALNTLMATNTEVSGTFADASNVTLKARTAFLNCTVTGLEASTAYDVSLNKRDKVSITTDASGNLHFLAWHELGNESEGVAYEDIPDLRFYIGTNKRVILGSKTLYAKVYNVTRAAETYTPFTVIDNTTDKEVEPENSMFYDFKEGDANITVSGENEGQTITLWGSRDRVVLSGVTATCGDAIINEENSEGTLNVELSGANSITITDPMTGGQAIHSNGYLYLSGNGTLTVTVTATDCYGLMGRNYQPSDNSNNDASVLAAMGHTVTRSAVTNNQDGTYSWTYTVAPIYMDPEGHVIEDDGVIGWLRDYGFTQADINALGHTVDATDYLYHCWLYNCDFRVAGAGCVSLDVTGTTSEGNYIKTATVQLIRKAPLGRINGHLYLYADGNRIVDESVEFFDDDHDDTFATAPSTGEVTQTATGTFNISITAMSITAEIRVQIIDNGEEGS